MSSLSEPRLGGIRCIHGVVRTQETYHGALPEKLDFPGKVAVHKTLVDLNHFLKLE